MSDTPPTNAAAQPEGPARSGLLGEKRDPAQVKELVVDAIKYVYDPEIPVNIFELGLIYGVEVDDAGNVKVLMTLTSPACPSAQELPLQVRSRVECIPQVSTCEVEIVWDPPWTPENMSEVARVALGMM